MAPHSHPLADPRLRDPLFTPILRPMMVDWMWQKRIAPENIPTRPRIEQWARMINFIDPQPSLIALYGSWGRGRRRLRDDVDLLVVVDWPFHPRPEPFTPETDAGMLYGRRQVILAAALLPPLRRLYLDMVLSTDILVLTSGEVATLRDTDDWLGDEVRSAFLEGEGRVIFKDGELQEGWRNYGLYTDPSPFPPVEDWSPFVLAKTKGQYHLDRLLKTQKTPPTTMDRGRSGANRG